MCRTASRLPQPEGSLVAPQHSQAERRAFHYYRHHAAPILAGDVDARFWKDLIPRLAQSYNFVWDTIVSISLLFEHVPYTSLTTVTDPACLTKVTNQNHLQALKLYNRAIANVRDLAERNQIDDAVVALSYILFASVEFQQRNVGIGRDLLKRCCKMLTENLTSPCIQQTSTASQAVLQVLTPFVLRKAVVTATLGNALPPRWVASGEASTIFKAVLSRFPSLHEAIVQFRSLVFRSYELIRLADSAPSISDDQPVKILFLSQRLSLLDTLILWKSSFTATRSGMSDLQTTWIASYLLMYWAVCYILLATCLSTRETSFDDYMDHFAEILEHAAVCLKHSAEFTIVPLISSSDPGVIPPLYFCATKCRDPRLRREALRLMRQAPRQENLWAFVASDCVVAKVITVEEGGCRPSVSGDFSPESQYAGLPPEERRFAYVNVVSRQAYGGRQRQILEMGRYEFAADGSRTLIHDYTWLEDEAELWPEASIKSQSMAAQDTKPEYPWWAASYDRPRSHGQSRDPFLCSPSDTSSQATSSQSSLSARHDIEALQVLTESTTATTALHSGNQTRYPQLPISI